ncbi:hypothetical protein RchiOBHm_Chr7g0190671 [Rosa chinensis]|uniref:Uncharacterized protein n=1 Tax=Rosa chinensis TaxID=74649 RepID=A0A2P6P552_ROSCH|nr:hypothetical protein RchiOBHm_Chr7g0190671 [Rosa chinensis]
MAEPTSKLPPPINPKSGFCSETKTFHSLRPIVPLPPLSQPMSLAHYTLSLLQSSSASTPPSSTPALIDASSARRLSYSQFLSQFHSLTLSLSPLLSKSQVAYILSPPSLHVPSSTSPSSP